MMALDWLHSYAARWHDAWEIAGAIGTVAAVGTALGLGYIEVRSNNERHRQDAKRLEDERDEARKAQAAAEERAENAEAWRQARAVAFWSYDHQIPTEYHPLAGVPIEFETVRRWTVENFSDDPIFDVVIQLRDSSRKPLGRTVRHAILRPGDSRSRDHEPGAVPWFCEVRFRDLRALEWIRTEDHLEPLDFESSTEDTPSE